MTLAFQNLKLPSPLELFDEETFSPLGLKVWIKRDDQIHATVSGNKWRKLKLSLEFAQREERSPIISFGGAYSNHLYSLAHAAREIKLPSVGLVRGEIDDPGNPTLQACREQGMTLFPLTREEYRQRAHESYIARWQARYPNALIVPEGGSNALALPGCRELAKELGPNFDYWLLPTASGGTLAGLASQGYATKILGIAVVKDTSLANRVQSLLADSGQTGPSPWQLLHDFTLSGYAKFDANLVGFLADCYARTGVPFDPIYSGKAVYALYQLAEKGFFPPGSAIVFIHTGGLQGILGLIQRGLLPQGYCGFKN